MLGLPHARCFTLAHQISSSMFLLHGSSVWLLFLFSAAFGHTLQCGAPNHPFPIPKFDLHAHEFRHAWASVNKALHTILDLDADRREAIAVEITTTKEIAYSFYRTGVPSESFPPETPVQDSNRVYGIGELTQVFTALAIANAYATKLIPDIDVSINEYVTELEQTSDNGIEWQNITLRSLATHLSGLPTDVLQHDLSTSEDHPWELGLPVIPDTELPKCGPDTQSNTSCSFDDLIKAVQKVPPVTQPGQRFLQSNVNFELLGLALQRATGISYEDYVQTTILSAIGMQNTTFGGTQASSKAFDILSSPTCPTSFGASNPSSGAYSTVSDLSKLLRYLLKNYKTLSEQHKPRPQLHRFSNVGSPYLGPWETVNTADILPYTTRTVKLHTKTSVTSEHHASLILVPEYGLGLTVLTTGDSSLVHAVQDAIVQPLIRAADRYVQTDLGMRYTGVFGIPRSPSPRFDANMPNGESSMAVAHSLPASLNVMNWTSNGTDVLRALAPIFGFVDQHDYTPHLVPTGLEMYKGSYRGEVWRVVARPAEPEDDKVRESSFRLSEHQCALDMDGVRYGGKPLNEVIFWFEADEPRPRAQKVELPGFRIVLDRGRKSSATASGLFVQGNSV